MSGEYSRVGLHMNSNKAQTDPVERRCSRTHEPAGRIEEPVDERQEGIILFTLRSKASSRPRCHEVFLRNNNNDNYRRDYDITLGVIASTISQPLLQLRWQS